MDLSIADCDVKVFRYFQDFVKIAEDNGLQQLIGKSDPLISGYKERMKARCRILAENVQTAVLRSCASRSSVYWIRSGGTVMSRCTD